MKKIILEEINRVRELMGVKPLILEQKIGNALEFIGKLWGRGEVTKTIDDFIIGKNYVGLENAPVRNWTDMVDLTNALKKNIDEVFPGFTDDLLLHILYTGSEGAVQTLKKQVVNKVYTQEMLKRYNLWDEGFLTGEQATKLRDDLLTIYNDMEYAPFKATLEETEMIQKLLNDTPKWKEGMSSASMSKAEYISEFDKIKNRILTDNTSEITQKEYKIIENGLNTGAIDDVEISKLMTAKKPEFSKVWRLYDEFRTANLSGKIDESLSFQEWLVNEIKTKAPSKFDKNTVITVQRFVQPFLRTLGITKAGSWRIAFTKVMGMTFTAILVALNEVIELVQLGAGEASDEVTSGTYPLKVKDRWKEYWESKNPKQKRNDELVSIYAEPDDINKIFKNTPPDIEVMDPEEQQIKIVDDDVTISLGGKPYNQFHFRLERTVLTMDLNPFEEDFIEPLKEYKAPSDEKDKTSEQEGGEKSNTEVVNTKVKMNEEEFKKSYPNESTEDEIIKVIEKLKANNEAGNYTVKEDGEFIRKINDTDFKYLTSNGTIYDVKITK
jgi:hypothetical protein